MLRLLKTANLDFTACQMNLLPPQQKKTGRTETKPQLLNIRKEILTPLMLSTISGSDAEAKLSVRRIPHSKMAHPEHSP